MSLYAQTLGAEPVYVSGRVNQPYIFALFYAKTPPEDFCASVEYQDENAAFRQAERFAGYEFRDPSRCPVLILWKGDAEGYPVLGRFGDYAVCVNTVEETET